MSKNKIGEILIITEDFTIETMISDKSITIKKGDRGFVDSRGCINYITGAGRGRVQKLRDAKLEGYDNASISELILKKLDSNYDIKQRLEDYDIEEKDFRETIEEILDEILK